MKSIFKKLAFVLALAMIVTLVPAKSAKAAATFSVSKSSIIYVGGSYAGYPASKYVKSWGYDKDTYTVSYESSNKDVATVSAKGLISAVSVGTAVITVTLQNEDGSIYASNSTKVFVKKNAVGVELGAGTQTHITTGVDAGESFYLAVKRTAADGTTAWKGKKVITDYVKYESSDEKVFTVDKFGKLTGVAAGTATLTMTTMELDGTKDTTKAVATTTPVTYTVKVTAGSIVEAKQTASKVVKLTISSAAAAAKLVATGVSAFNADYIVNKITSVSQIKSVAIDADNAAVVDVTLYNVMTAGYTYEFAIAATPDAKVTVIGAQNTIVSMAGLPNTGYVGTNASDGIAPLYAFYNADGIDITEAVKDEQSAYISFDFVKEDANYSLTTNACTGKVQFKEAGSADITVTYDYWDAKGVETKYTGVSTVTALATTSVYSTPTYTITSFTNAEFQKELDSQTWYSKKSYNNSAAFTDASYPYTHNVTNTNNAIYHDVIKGESNLKLYATIPVVVDGKTTITYPDTSDDLHDTVVYESSNNNVLVASADSNGLCDVDAISAGTANITVKYKLNNVETIVAVLPVTVYDKKVLTSISISGNGDKDSVTASVDSDNDGVFDSGSTTKTLELYAYDQLGRKIDIDQDLCTSKFEVLACANCKDAKAGDQFYTGNSWVTGCYGQKSVLTVSGVTSAKTASATVKVTVKYNGVTLTKTTVPTFRIPTETKSYNLKVSAKNQGWWAFDTNIDSLTEPWIYEDFGLIGDTKNAATFGPSFSVVETDANGFNVGEYTLSHYTTTGSYVVVKIDNTTVADADDSIWNLYTTTSGSSVIKSKKDAATYTAKLYKVTAGTTDTYNFLSSTSITVNDTTAYLTFVEDNAKSLSYTSTEAVNDCFSVYKNSVKLAKGSYTVDVKDSGDNLIIKSFSYTQTSPDGYTYVVKTPVGLTIYAPNVSE